MHGLGAVSARWLETVGITTEEDLRSLRAVEAFARVRLAAAPTASLNLLYALEAVLRGVDWRSLPDEVKRSLKETYINGAR